MTKKKLLIVTYSPEQMQMFYEVFPRIATVHGTTFFPSMYSKESDLTLCKIYYTDPIEVYQLGFAMAENYYQSLMKKVEDFNG